jgi:hypothetical protein
MGASAVAASSIAGVRSAAILVGLATRRIDLPGLYYDELFEVVPSLAFVESGLASSVAKVPRSQIWNFGHPLPRAAV